MFHNTKFHLRAYCVACGDLTLYLYTRVLALFSSKPYTPPAHAVDGTIDLAPHLTNTSLQIQGGEEGVRLLDELAGCHILSCGVDATRGESTLTSGHLADIQDQIADSLAETFKAALQWPIHFQVRSSSERSGFMDTYRSTATGERFRSLWGRLSRRTHRVVTTTVRGQASRNQRRTCDRTHWPSAHLGAGRSFQCSCSHLC